MRIRSIRSKGRWGFGVIGAVAATALIVTAQGGAAQAASPKLSAATTVGVHNAYQKDTFKYFANALDSGSSLLEIDIWADSLTKRWRVSHSNPLGDDNNCEDASKPADLYSKNRNQDFGSCLDNIAAWQQLHPDHRPITFKIEMKNGYNNDVGLGPDELDALISAKLGSTVFKPSDLLGSTYSTLDAAAQADAWPSRDALAGKVMFEVIPGTFEKANPFDSYWTDVEYATYLRNLYAAGNVSKAEMFPAVLDAAAGDPRTRYADTTLRPWFVVFDGDAATYVNNGYDTAWYDNRHYLLIMTGAAGVSPAISSTAPTEAEALARLSLLAADHASIMTADWSTLSSTVLGAVTTRG
jgi:hypothetical protein